MELTKEEMETLISLFDWVDTRIGLVPEEIEIKEKIERCLKNA